MKSNKIIYSLIIRSLLLSATSILLSYLIIKLSGKHIFFIPLMVFIILLIQITELTRFILNSNRRVLDYLGTIKDLSLSLEKKHKNDKYSFEHIRDSINDLMKIVNESKFEKEIQKQYLQLIINSIKVGVISYNQNKEIVLINNTAKSFIKNKRLDKINDLEQVSPQFYTEILSIENRKSKLVTFNQELDNTTLTISKSVFKIGTDLITNITFQDIKNEIVQNEIESWRRLIKVLRHEILNSITPISTLTDTIISIISDENGKQKTLDQLTKDDLNDINESMKSIKSRSHGLFDFVNIYRQIDQIPTPKMERFQVKELINSIIPLFNNQFQEKGISFSTSIPDEIIFLKADFSLIQQVLINLIKNSIEASIPGKMQEIMIHVRIHQNKISIDIIDHGFGIPNNQLSQIFVPLFTTKETGSGIGLFLSQQIMQLHNGTIQVKSRENVETTFTLNFYV